MPGFACQRMERADFEPAIPTFQPFRRASRADTPCNRGLVFIVPSQRFVMSLYLWHVEPDVFGFQARVPERRANAVRIDARCFIPEKEGS
jgi:hypothetical protein